MKYYFLRKPFFNKAVNASSDGSSEKISIIDYDDNLLSFSVPYKGPTLEKFILKYVDKD